jgi:hypothetical protein
MEPTTFLQHLELVGVHSELEVLILFYFIDLVMLA